jgi:hypothetical protein
MHKSIVPSEKVGIEFARKLICTEGNLSPLPIILLTMNGLVVKVQFICKIVDRILTDGILERPDFKEIFTSVFGPVIGDKLMDPIIKYYLFSMWRKRKADDIKEGSIPELLRVDRNVNNGITLVSDLLCLRERQCLAQMESFLDEIRNRKIKEFKKINQFLETSLTRNWVVEVGKILDSLGSDRPYSLEGKTNFVVFLSQWVRGPLSYY